ncbi:hypothetical protein XELAEV_18012972mg [Xenopus laevis]|uniref:Uncharacterized protein n=1 Tax=Xenopus laevis TaxID=8355 RepID=A0A974HYY3_XENLA|nr:hypothetical protein XELAEV_18012972mg [Xenopus laevis]
MKKKQTEGKKRQKVNIWRLHCMNAVGFKQNLHCLIDCKGRRLVCSHSNISRSKKICLTQFTLLHHFRDERAIMSVMPNHFFAFYAIKRHFCQILSFSSKVRVNKAFFKASGIQLYKTSQTKGLFIC